MAYTPGQPFTYGIPDGTYTGRPTTASCFEKDGRLILDVNFAVKDPQTGEWYKKDNGYEWEAKKRHWLSSKDGGFHAATITGIREWAKGWNPTSFDDFYWFQLPDANGVPFGNLAAIGEVELNFQTDNQGNQQIWVHDPNRPKAGGRKAFVPDGATTDKATLMAKWGTKAKALFAATPKKVGAGAPAQAAHPSSDRQGGSLRSGDMAAPKPAQAAPAAGGGVAPSRPQGGPAAPSRTPLATAGAAPSGRGISAGGAPAKADPWAEFPATCDGAFAYFCSLLGEAYSGAKHDKKWFALFDAAAQGKDPDEFDAADVQRLFQTIKDGMAG